MVQWCVSRQSLSRCRKVFINGCVCLQYHENAKFLCRFNYSHFLCPFALRILKVVLGEGAREEWFKQAYEKNPKVWNWVLFIHHRILKMVASYIPFYSAVVSRDGKKALHAFSHYFPSVCTSNTPKPVSWGCSYTSKL